MVSEKSKETESAAVCTNVQLRLLYKAGGLDCTLQMVHVSQWFG